MITGIGVDVVEIDRVREAVEEYGGKFLGKIYTKNEIAYCMKRNKLRFPELAVRFAAKEAYSKAIGTGMRGIKWREIEVVNNSRGKPHIALSGKICMNIHLSLSHSKNYAVASVVVEGQ
jgi:holo-[acyl-carrier protein] synthase